MEETDNRFTWNFKNDVQFLDDQGRVISDPKSYFERKRTEDITYHEFLEIGDVVSTKGVDYLVKVKRKNVETIIGVYDYAGSVLGSDSEDLVLFQQKDILEKKNVGKAIDNKYEVLKLIGQGGFFTTYLGKLFGKK